MHFPSFTLGTALLLNVLPVFGKFCWPKGNPKKVVLNFDDIPTPSTSDFIQLGEPDGVPFIYNGFKITQDQQWLLLRCNNFENVPWATIYYQSCGGTPQAVYSSGLIQPPESTLTGPPMFDVDSFFITPVQFGNASTPVTLKVTGRNYLYDGWTPTYETKVNPDVRNEVKGLRERGFFLLDLLEIHVFNPAGQTMAYVLDGIAVRQWNYDCI